MLGRYAVPNGAQIVEDLGSEYVSMHCQGHVLIRIEMGEESSYTQAAPKVRCRTGAL
jgi:hypothetical protein